MSTAAFLAGPALLLVAAWALLTAYDARQPRRLRLAVGALVLAALATALGVATDAPPRTSPGTGSTPSSST